MAHRGVGCGVAALAVSMTFCSVAAAAPPRRDWVPASLDQAVSSDHFVVHYSVTPGDANAIPDPALARALLSSGEAAYAYESGTLGFHPLDDGDGKVDIYVMEVTHPAGDVEAIT